jgi:hypothetical protein
MAMSALQPGDRAHQRSSAAYATSYRAAWTRSRPDNTATDRAKNASRYLQARPRRREYELLSQFSRAKKITKFDRLLVVSFRRLTLRRRFTLRSLRALAHIFGQPHQTT